MNKKLATLVTRANSVNESILTIDAGFEKVLVAHYGADRLAQIRASRVKAVGELSSIEKQMKEVARSEAVTGENKILVDDDKIKISVSGTKPEITYDTEKALKLLPDDLLDEVLDSTVNAERMAAKIVVGLPEETLKKVMECRIEVPKTAAVSVKFKAPEAAPVSDVAPVAPVVPFRKTGT